MRHDGDLGCRRAQERDDIAGCAGDVIGAIACTEAGSVDGSDGCKIGEVNKLVSRLACLLVR